MTAARTGRQRTARASIGAAVALVALKLGTGSATGSLSLISAGIESSGDVVAAVLTFLAVGLGGRPADAALLAIALTLPAIKEVHDVNVFEHERGAIVTLHGKFDRSVPLAEAHRVADEIEARLRALDGVAEARTHLEPLEPERRLAGDPDRERDVAWDIRTLVERLTGRAPADLRVLRTRAGLVVLLTVAVAADLSLRDAHDIAGALEAAIRADRDDVAEVVVHTEPTADGTR